MFPKFSDKRIQNLSLNCQSFFWFLFSLSQSLKEYILPDDLLDNYFLCKSSKQIVCKIGKKWFKVNMCWADQIFWINLFFHDEIQCFSQWQCEISDFISFLESFLFLLFLWFLLFFLLPGIYILQKIRNYAKPKI